ncbi:RecQ family ATP-dependent DNA helicase, partial [Enterococcus faecium]
LVQKQLDFPLTLALSATATPVEKHAIIKQLFSHGSYQEVLSSVNRKNIGLFVKETSEKVDVLLGYISKTAGKIITYSSTRNKKEQI